MIDIARPDPPLLEQIRTAIEDSPYVGRRKLRCENEHGHVRLRGHVETYFQKQMAQETVLRLDGVQHVENLLEVGE